MTKKNKNIITLLIIFILIIIMSLTIYFFKSHNYRDFGYGQSIPITDNYDDTFNRRQEEDNKNRFNVDDNKVLKYNNQQNNHRFIKPIFNSRSNNSTRYIVLLCLETFLLGNCVMYLIINNIDRKDNGKIVEVLDKTKKNKIE